MIPLSATLLITGSDMLLKFDYKDNNTNKALLFTGFAGKAERREEINSLALTNHFKPDNYTLLLTAFPSYRLLFATKKEDPASGRDLYSNWL
jgi:hypothetical protein